MSIQHCEDCDMDDVDTPATVTWEDPWGRPYAHLCARHADAREGAAEAPNFDESLGAVCDARETARRAQQMKEGDRD